LKISGLDFDLFVDLRMESVYRRWIQEKDIRDNAKGGSDPNIGFDDMSRELHTTLGTAKWQVIAGFCCKFQSRIVY
jgi:hypothetical protein